MGDLQETTWRGAVPLRISLSPLDCRSYDDSLPFLIQAPRLSYLPFLLEKLHGFYADALINPDTSPHEGWFSFEGVPLKWHYPIGLLFDLLGGSSSPVSNAQQDDASLRARLTTAHPSSFWNIQVHFSAWPTEQLTPLDASGKLLQDVFIQSVKEADYLRNGTAKTVMSLSKEDSTILWNSVQEHDLHRFAPLYRRLLNPQGGDRIRHVPLKVYIPQAAQSTKDQLGTDGGASEDKGSLRVVQGLVSPTNPRSKSPQTLGTTLHDLLPKLFPSRTISIHASAVLHGVRVPLSTKLEDLMEGAAFADGFLHVAVNVLDFGDDLHTAS